MTDRPNFDRPPYTPPDHYFSPQMRIQQPHRIRLNPAWLFSAESYERMRMGHEAQGDSDLWNCYVDPNTGMFHAHRAPTGYEIYRMPFDQVGTTYRAPKVVVEMDPERHTPTDWHNRPADDAFITGFFGILLTNVLHAPPTRLQG